jgi:CRISPR/Cas system CSM-associated protein Csm3 (group 7 of RAMP superfamily)
MSGFDTFQSRLVVTGQLELRTPMRIGSGKSSEVTSPDQPVMKDTLGHPIIPGSSLKGVLRSHLESLLRAIENQPGFERSGCDILSEDGRSLFLTACPANQETSSR